MILESINPIPVKLQIKLDEKYSSTDLDCEMRVQLSNSKDRNFLNLSFPPDQLEDLRKILSFRKNEQRNIECRQCGKSFHLDRDRIEILTIKDRIYGVGLKCPHCDFEEGL